MKTLQEYLALDYPIKVRELMTAEGGGWLVTFPDLKGIIDTGETLEEAIEDATEAKNGWLEILVADGKVVPEPNSAQYGKKDAL